MEMREVTFTVPEEVAARFFERVPTDQRSSWFAQAVNRPAKQEISDEELIAACEALNDDADLRELEKDWDACGADGLDEYPWQEPATR